MRRWTVGVVAATALLAGCSSAPEASHTLPTTAAPTTAQAAKTLPPLGPADLPMPAEARQKTPEGVKAFTAYYFQLISHELTALDSAPLRLIARDCETCNQIANGYDEARDANRHFEGGAISVISTGSVAMDGDSAEISIYLDQASSVLREASGAAVPGRSAPETKLTGGLKVIWSDAHKTWLVTQLDADRL